MTLHFQRNLLFYINFLKNRLCWKVLFLLLFFFQPLIASAVSDTYTFTSPVLQNRYQHLSDELRCLVCQNQSLSDSNAPLAKDLRAQVVNMLNQGKTDDEIKAYLVARYGNFILFRPPWDKTTLFLWLAPFLLLIIGFIIVYRVKNNSTKELSLEDRQKLKALLHSEGQE